MTTPEAEDQDQTTGPVAALRRSLADNDFSRGADAAGAELLGAARHIAAAADALTRIRTSRR